MDHFKLSPHKFSLCYLVHWVVQNRENASQQHAIISQFLANQIKRIKTHNEPTLAELKNLLTGKLGPTGKQLFKLLKKHLDSMKYVDDLYDFMKGMGNDIPSRDGKLPDSDDVVDAASIFGIFIRKMLLSFHVGSFAQLSRLFEDIEAYKNTKGQTEGFKGQISRMELDSYVQQKTKEIERNLGTMSFSKVQKMIDDILDICNDLPSVHNLALLNCIHHREYACAIDHLYRYFDYYLQSYYLQSMSPRADLAPETQDSCAAEVIQYAIFNKGVLHFRFGHHEQACKSIFETIKIAQPGRDRTCLAHALSVMVRLVEQKGNILYMKQLLDRCVAGGTTETREKPTSDDSNENITPPEVDTQSWLYMTKYYLEHPSKEKYSEVDIMSVWHSLTKSMTSCDLNDLPSVTGSAWLLLSSVWKRFGSSFLSSLCSQMHCRYYASQAATDDNAVAVCNLALEKENSNDLKVLLKFGSKLFSASSPFGYAEMVACLNFNHAIKKNDVKSVDKHAREMFGLSPNEMEGFQFYFDARFMEAQEELRNGDLHKAFDHANSLTKLCTKRGQEIRLPQLLLFIAKVFQKAGNTSTSLAYILRCLTLCSNYHLDNTLCEATLILGEIHKDLRSPELGLAVVRGVLPQILGHCSPDLEIQAYITMAKCLGSIKSQPKEQCLRQAVRYLHCARKICYSNRAVYESELKYIFYILTRVYHELGNQKNRNRAADEFCRLDSLQSSLNVK